MESFNKIEEYIPAFEKKLTAINVEALLCDPYCKKYLQHLLQHSRFYLKIYAFVLTLVLNNSRHSKEEIVLVDYGAGNGLLGLFAKFCGFDKVYINDHNKKFVDSAKELSILFNLPIDGFIEGDIITVGNFFNAFKPTVIIGTDVIEHIYDLDIFFTELKRINPSIISVFTTASNPFNKYKVKQLENLQRKDEYIGNSINDNPLYEATVMEPFIKIREKILRANFPNLPDAAILQLATLTRGLIKDDIIKASKKYNADNSFPVQLKHPTNTCDPITGSWTERVLTESAYRKIYTNADFTLKIYSGFYNEFDRNVKSTLLKIVNTAIKLTGHSIAPFICLVGIPEKK